MQISSIFLLLGILLFHIFNANFFLTKLKALLKNKIKSLYDRVFLHVKIKLLCFKKELYFGWSRTI